MTITIRRATRDDTRNIVQLMKRLAKYEKMEDSFKPSITSLALFLQNTDISREGIFPVPDPRQLHAWVAETEHGSSVGFAMGFYGGFSSFASSWEFCLHDLYVEQSVRRQGVAKQFFSKIAKEVCEYTHTISFEVLDWNYDAVRLYEGLGAHYYGQRIEQDGTTWKQYKIEGKAFELLLHEAVQGFWADRALSESE